MPRHRGSPVATPLPSEAKLSPAQAQLHRFVLGKSGLCLEAARPRFVEDRLAPILRQAGIGSLERLMDQLKERPGCALEQTVLDALATHETSFFRDRQPFETFAAVMLTRLVSARGDGKKIRIWSAGCASGQEPYSLAMSLADRLPVLPHGQIEIIATDISGPMLTKAGQGRYSQFEVQRGLPIDHLLRHFRRERDCWFIEERLRAGIHFKHFNLLHDFQPLGRFDIVFCRNVLLYLAPDIRHAILSRLAAVIAEDGYLVLGASETVLGLTDAFRPDPEHPFVFRPLNGAPTKSPAMAGLSIG